jgi:hypothetical protein
MRFASAFVVTWLVVCTVSSARDIYVDNVGGDDRFDGAMASTSGGASGPVRSIACALRKAEKGDRIVIAATGQPYRESVTLQAGRHSGIVGQPFEIVGNGAVLEGAAPVPAGDWEHVHQGIFRCTPPRMSYQLLFLDGQPAERVTVAPGTWQLPVLKPLQWCLFERHIYFRPEAGRLPDSYHLQYAGLPVGITLYEVRSVIVRDLVVQGFQLDGVNAHDGVFDATLSGLTCRGNARSGISIGGASRVLIENCLCGNNGHAQLRTEGQSHTRIVNSELLDNTAPALRREGGRVTSEPVGQGPAAATDMAQPVSAVPLADN